VAATERTLTRVPVIKRVNCDDEHIYVDLADGRVLGVPLAWSERLSKATAKQRANYEIEQFGGAIHWPDVDEDIGLATSWGSLKTRSTTRLTSMVRPRARGHTSPSPTDGHAALV